MRLSPAALAALSPAVRRPAYDRSGQRAGIVHFGAGAFQRAHLGWYTEAALHQGDRGWGIVGVSLRSADVAAQLNPQAGLYTLTQRAPGGDATQLIGNLQSVLVARDSPARVIAAVASPDTRIVSFTITEKGYCRAADGSFDVALADEHSVWRYLREGLAARRAAKLPGLTLLCCDNLAGNGRQLERLLSECLGRHDAGLATWAREQCRCPSTMVDRIVPATTPADRAQLAQRIGIEDAAAVFTEPFTQWVIEDAFAGERPHWEAGGAQIAGDVRPYETAKLRMLNGSHSLLAYLGLWRGHTFVHQAITDPGLRALVEQLMLREAAPTLPPAAGFDAASYARDLLQRFANAALPHRLAQIAMDGSQKIPQRWLETLAANASQDRQCPALLQALAGWMRFVRGDRFTVDDPAAPALAAEWAGRGADGVLERLFGADGMFAAYWRPAPPQRAWLQQQLAALA